MSTGRSIIAAILTLAFFATCPLCAATLNPWLAKLTTVDTLLNIWVIFADKPQNPTTGQSVVAHAALRRERAGFPRFSQQDLPVSEDYLRAVERAGAIRRNVFKWANAASYSVSSSRLGAVAALPFVDKVVPLGEYTMGPVSSAGLPKITRKTNDYGGSFNQLSIIGVPDAHRYLALKGLEPAHGVVIGVFDEGFWLGHSCFSHFAERQAVVADSDFVEHKSSPYITSTGHGTQTMSLIGGYDKGDFIGVGWAARFIVARTEEGVEERHSEEDNWAAAVVWAESLGVDIISSSLGYRYKFTLPDAEYSYADMNGTTTIVSKAAQWAIDRGVIVVNSVGNEGRNVGGTGEPGTISAPADVNDVVSVGAIASSRILANFSSTGPTSDGRLKPDVVAIGVAALVANGNSYSTGDGTSFSAPMVAGVVALIKQLYPLESAAQIRSRLYASCSLAPGQDSIDNFYGRGIPDALLACLGPDEIFVSCSDSSGSGIAGVKISAQSGSGILSDSSGFLIVTASSGSFPETLSVTHPYFNDVLLVLDSVRVRRAVVLDSCKLLRVIITDSANSPIALAHVYARRAGEETAFTEHLANRSGMVVLPRKEAARWQIHAVAAGYLATADTLIEYAAITDTLFLRLHKEPSFRFSVFPTVISQRNFLDNMGVTVDFLTPEETLFPSGQLCKVAIRNAGGNLVWNYTASLVANTPLATENGSALVWNGRCGSGAVVSPGVYIVIIRYADKTYTKKVLVTG